MGSDEIQDAVRSLELVDGAGAVHKPPPLKGQDDKGLYLLIVLISFLINFTIRSPSLEGDLLYDDENLLNKQLISMQDLPSLFFPQINFFSNMYYRPFWYLSYHLDRWVLRSVGRVGDPAFVLHLHSLLIHCLASISVIFLFKTLFPLRGRWSWLLPLSASLFMGLHPINTEPAAWISDRCDLYLGLLMTLSLTLFVSFRRTGSPGRLIASTLLLWPSLLFKENAAGGILVFIFYDLFMGPFRRMREKGARSGWMALLLPYLLFSAGIFFTFRMRGLSLGEKGAVSFREGDPLGLAKDLFLSMGYSLKSIAFPFTYRVFTGVGEIPGNNPEKLLGIFVLASAMIAAFLLLRSREGEKRVAGFFLGSTILFYIPSSFTAIINTLSSPVADRYAYLSTIPFSCLLSIVLYRITLKVKGERRAVALFYLSSGIVFLIYSSITIQKTGYWTDEFSFWDRASRESPGSSIPYSFLGKLYLQKGMECRTEEREGYLLKALDLFRKSVDPFLIKEPIRKYMAISYNFMGATYLQLGDREKARAVFNLALSPSLEGTLYPTPHYNLALMDMEDGDMDGAESHLKEAINLDPFYLKAHFLLAGILEMRGGERGEIMRSYRIVSSLSPGSSMGKEAKKRLFILEGRDEREETE